MEFNFNTFPKTEADEPDVAFTVSTWFKTADFEKKNPANVLV